MILNIQILNADENLLKVLKGVINLHPQAKIKVKKQYDEPTEETREALMNPESIGVFDNMEDLKKALES